MNRTLALTGALILLLTASAYGGQALTLSASFYSLESLKREGTFKTSKGVMANGHVFNENAMTCACRLYPLGAVLKITNTKNGASVVVTVTDRIGKRFAKTRIDLSKAAFQKIAPLSAGVVPITAERIK